MYGSDAANSVEPEGFRILVEEIRKLDLALNTKIDKNQKVKKLEDILALTHHRYKKTLVVLHVHY